MLKVMNMSTGKIIEDEFGSFEDEVLGAGWLPPVPELQLGLQQISHDTKSESDFDVDAFLSKVYRNQA
ncbi:conserved protein of unknown function [Georgfuchsia toluolica]|uniref:Uncharacterized protein n=1 Tax=Georgfuchsia toluolica TaxID=424218 RepID=A0A916J658_9PROT|nr:hypothetical protein [Georgfuchsia toluolica]CAG4884630.1 conserved protein of unknown function [Georgfuchsia toluolica]